MPNNEIHVGWIKALDPKQKSLFQCTFLLCLECHLRATVERRHFKI